MMRKLLAAFVCHDDIQRPIAGRADDPALGNRAAEPASRRKTDAHGHLLQRLRAFLRRRLPHGAENVSGRTARRDQDDAIAVDRLDLLRDDVRRVLFPDGRLRSGVAPLHQRPATLQAVPRLDDEGAIRGGDPRRQPGHERWSPGAPARDRPSWAHYPDNVRSCKGRSTSSRHAAKQGTPSCNRPTAYPITPQEIVRCTTLAMRRRAELLGPVAKYDALTVDVLAATRQPIGPPNHWSECVGRPRTRLGAAGRRKRSAGHRLFAAGRAGRRRVRPSADQHRAVGTGPAGVAERRLRGRREVLRRSHLRGGELFPHHRRRPRRGFPLRHDDAPDGQQQRTVSRRWSRPFMGEGQSASPIAGLTVPLRRRELRRAGRNPAGRGHARRRPGHDRPTARWAPARSAAASTTSAPWWPFSRGGLAEGNTALAAAMGYMRHGSLWLFHIGLADHLYASGTSRRGRPWTCSARCSAIRSQPTGPSTRWNRWPC